MKLAGEKLQVWQDKEAGLCTGWSAGSVGHKQERHVTVTVTVTGVENNNIGLLGDFFVVMI